MSATSCCWLLNLPLVSVFVTVLRIPYAYLYPLIIMFCIIGVYEVNNSIVDVWIMLIMGVLGYALRKFDFDPAPLVLGLVIAPILEQSLRQSLIMSNGNYLIFFSRPISLGLMVVSIGLLALSAYAFVLKRADWRTKLAEVEAGEVEPLATSRRILRACSAIAISAVPPNIMLMPTSKPDRPGRGARQAGEDHHGEPEIDDAAHQHPAPLAGQFALVIEREHDRYGALDQEERDQHQRERECAGQRRASSIAPTTMPSTADSSDHQKPGACRIQKVVTRPTMPLTRNSQPNRMVTARVAIGGRTTAVAPSTSSTTPSTRKRTQCSCSAAVAAR